MAVCSVCAFKLDLTAALKLACGLARHPPGHKHTQTRTAAVRHSVPSLSAPCSLTCFTIQLCASNLEWCCSCLKTYQPWPAAGKRRKVTRETYNDKGEEVTEEMWEDADVPGQGDAQAAPASAGLSALAATPSQPKTAAEGGTKAKQGGQGSSACLGGASACAWQCRFATPLCQMLVVLSARTRSIACPSCANLFAGSPAKPAAKFAPPSAKGKPASGGAKKGKNVQIAGQKGIASFFGKK